MHVIGVEGPCEAQLLLPVRQQPDADQGRVPPAGNFSLFSVPLSLRPDLCEMQLLRPMRQHRDADQRWVLPGRAMSPMQCANERLSDGGEPRARV